MYSFCGRMRGLKGQFATKIIVFGGQYVVTCMNNGGDPAPTLTLNEACKCFHYHKHGHSSNNSIGQVVSVLAQCLDVDVRKK